MVAVNCCRLADLAIAEPCGRLLSDKQVDILAQRPLVGFQCKDVIGLLGDDPLRDRPLATPSGLSIRLRLTEPLASLADRVDRDDRALDRQHVEQLWDSYDFIRFIGHLDLTQH